MDRIRHVGGEFIVSNRLVFERLERRVLLHAGHLHVPLELGLPAEIISDDGHIRYSDFVNLSPKLQAQIDPHFIENDISAEPINYDEILGIPLSVSGRDNPDADTFPDWYPAVNGSISVNQTSQPGRTLIMFPTAINNQGSGPGIGISGRPGIDPIPSGAPITSWLTPDGGQALLQPIYNFSGGVYTLSSYRNAGSFTYHSGHSHYHFDGYNNYRLRQSNGGVPGNYVMRPDGTEIIGEKVGFCLINVLSSFIMENGQSSTTLPGYNASGQPGTGCGFTQGVHVGKADQYGSGTSGQWLDVTGVPNGNYFLEITVDGENVMQETNEANNSKNFPFTLNVNPPVGGITPDEFDTGGNNNTLANATDMGQMGVYTKTGLNIHWGQDYDYFEFTATSTGSGTVATTPAAGDVNLYLYDSAGTPLATSSNSTGTDTITWNFVEGRQYYAEARTYNSGVSSNYQIAWNIKPTINAATTDGSANEYQNQIGVISVARNGPVESSLPVNFTVSGSATRGVDYDIYHQAVLIAGNTFNISNLASVADLEIRPINDHVPEPSENVTITLAGSAAYVIGAGTSGTVTIGDSGPEVTSTTQIWQTSPHKLIFDIARAQAASLALSDFAVLNLDTNQPVIPQGLVVQDNGGSATATLTFTGVLPDGHYRATILAGSISNADGDANFADIPYNFFVLTGDANHDGRVNLFDFDILASNFGQTGRDGSTGDFDYDGDCDLADFDVLASKFGVTLAGPDGAAATVRTGLFADGRGIDDNDRLDELA